MSFQKAPIRRFNETSGCAPPIGSYNPKFVTDVAVASTSKGITFDRSGRFVGPTKKGCGSGPGSGLSSPTVIPLLSTSVPASPGSYRPRSTSSHVSASGTLAGSRRSSSVSSPRSLRTAKQSTSSLNVNSRNVENLSTPCQPNAWAPQEATYKETIINLQNNLSGMQSLLIEEQEKCKRLEEQINNPRSININSIAVQTVVTEKEDKSDATEDKPIELTENNCLKEENLQLATKEAALNGCIYDLEAEFLVQKLQVAREKEIIKILEEKNRIQESTIKSLQSEVETHDYQLTAWSKTERQFTDSIGIFMRANSELQNNLEEKGKQCSTLEEDRNVLAQKLSDSKAEVDLLNLKMDELKKENEDLSRYLDDLKSALFKEDEKCKLLAEESGSWYTFYQEQISEIEGKKEEWETKETDFITSIKELEMKLADANQAVEEQHIQSQLLKKSEVSEWANVEITYQETIISLTSKVADLESDVKLYQTQIETLHGKWEELVHAKKEVDYLKGELQRVQSELEKQSTGEGKVPSKNILFQQNMHDDIRSNLTMNKVLKEEIEKYCQKQENKIQDDTTVALEGFLVSLDSENDVLKNKIAIIEKMLDEDIKNNNDPSMTSTGETTQIESPQDDVKDNENGLSNQGGMELAATEHEHVMVSEKLFASEDEDSENELLVVHE